MKRAAVNLKRDSVMEEPNSYSSVGHNDHREGDEPEPTLMELFIIKMQALIWVTIAVFIIIKTDLVPILLSDSRIERFYLNASIVCFTFNFISMLYALFFLPYIQGVKVPWNIYVPRLVPTTALLAILGGLAFTRSLWGVFGFLSPLIVLFESFGLFYSLHFIPSLPFLD